MAKNRLLAAKHDKAKVQRAAAFNDVMLKEASYSVPMTDRAALICAIARREDVVSIGGRAIRKIKQGVNGLNAAKRQPDARMPSIIAMHF